MPSDKPVQIKLFQFYSLRTLKSSTTPACFYPEAHCRGNSCFSWNFLSFCPPTGAQGLILRWHFELFTSDLVGVILFSGLFHLILFSYHQGLARPSVSAKTPFWVDYVFSFLQFLSRWNPTPPLKYR
jgi:hypothetical protein